MKSTIFRTATQLLIPLLLLVSIFLLLRGHNEPGGGFVGGLVASSAFILFAWANSTSETRRLLAVDPRVLIGAGLAVTALSGLPALFRGEPYLTALKWGVFGGESIVISTPAIFDIGVFLTVLGVVLNILLSLEEE